MKRLILSSFYLICLVSTFIPNTASCQEDLMDLLDDLEEEKTEYVTASFKTVRILNSHSVKSPAPGVLTMVLSHRFGRINDGPYEFFGLDQANMRLGFDYSINNRLCLGIGRSNVRKTYDGFVKLTLLRQSIGKKTMPFSLVYVGGMQVNSLRWAEPNRINYYTSRLTYSHQLLLGRKFNDNLSLQFMPTMIHRNLVATVEEENDVFAMGVGGRLKVTPSLTFNFEYFYLLPGYTAENFSNSLSLGIDIETGGHVFQLIFSNSVGMTENLFIAETDGKWALDDVHFGFNLTRVFTVKRHK